MVTPYTISDSFPFSSKFLKVDDANIHYIDEGQGDPIVFLHGIPTNNYLWRNVIPQLTDVARCIAPDLVGMGKSSKPPCAYRVFDHIRYIEGFIKTLKLKRVTLVMHGWGSVIGFDYARRHRKNIHGLAFLESLVRPIEDWKYVSLPLQELSTILNEPDGGYEAIMNGDYFVDRVLPSGMLRRLTDKEMEHYRTPFKQPGSHQPLWQYLQDLPLGNGPKDVLKLIKNYSAWLQKTSLPKLMLYAVPGFNTTMETVKWSRDHLPNLTLVDIGEALHYAQESNPHKLGEELRSWYHQLVPESA